MCFRICIVYCLQDVHSPAAGIYVRDAPTDVLCQVFLQRQKKLQRA